MKKILLKGGDRDGEECEFLPARFIQIPPPKLLYPAVKYLAYAFVEETETHYIYIYQGVVK